MKKILILVALSVSMATAFSQEVRLNLYNAYVFNENFKASNDVNTYYNGTLNGGYQWGAGVEYVPFPQGSIELLYQHQSTHAPTTYKDGVASSVKNENFDVGLNYIMLSADGHMGNNKIEGYGGIMVGVLLDDVKAPSTGGTANNTDFAWGGRLGANIWVSKKVGIKLQALLLSGSRATGGDLYFGFYGPVVLTTYSNIYQFSLGGGLTFKLGK